MLRTVGSLFVARCIKPGSAPGWARFGDDELCIVIGPHGRGDVDVDRWAAITAAVHRPLFAIAVARLQQEHRGGSEWCLLSSDEVSTKVIFCGRAQRLAHNRAD